jgi:transcriptional regulator with XRE-family HTH domain
MSFGERLRQIRKALDMTQKEFGLRLGTSQGNLANVEGDKGTHLPDDALEVLAREFKVNLNYLYAGSGSMFEEDNSDEKWIASIIQRGELRGTIDLDNPNDVELRITKRRR